MTAASSAKRWLFEHENGVSKRELTRVRGTVLLAGDSIGRGSSAGTAVCREKRGGMLRALRAVMRWLAGCWVVLTVSCAAAAGATESTPLGVPGAGYRDHPLHLELIAGADTRVGELGVAAEYALGDPLSVGIGYGVNAFGSSLAAHARVRPIWSRSAGGKFFQALTVEGSVSRARYGDVSLIPCIDGCNDADVTPQPVTWAQAELGWETMFESGLTLRIASGFANEVGSYHWQCRYSYCSPPGRQVFVQTLAVGWAF